MKTITLITGGSRGLGRNTALSVARRGGDVIITYRADTNAAAQVVAEIEAMGRKAVALPLDVFDVADIARFHDEVARTLQTVWGRDSFDHLINNAGHGDMAPFVETSVAAFDALFGVHVRGVFFLTQTLAGMLANGGRIINFSSGLTRIAGEGFSAYAAAKGAIEVLTQYMAKELAPRRITANVVAPGAIETDFLGGAVRDTPEYNDAFASMTALGRVGVPDDIGPAVANLLDPAHRWMTAQRIEISGGQSI